ncbi:PAS domain-containing sensor histidine kinase [Heliorestis convoluta]|uniref:histidine kinase n=1 Tax=Heliorestis convoluta TaxID=356322 RepID=A0A5Q2MZH6_9FIRM|nr:PAS domain-containing sensor histidine kinase [Heliorestis convoluta]QGG46869.1 PAS/PAC sensor hybrid histidine kinase [Heliorestis convoluta]
MRYQEYRQSLKRKIHHLPTIVATFYAIIGATSIILFDFLFLQVVDAENLYYYPYEIWRGLIITALLYFTVRYFTNKIEKMDEELMEKHKSLQSAYREINTQLEALQKSERSRKQSEKRLTLLAKNSQDIIYRFQRNPFVFQYISPVIKKYTGYAPEDFYHNSSLISQVIHPDDQEKAKNVVQDGKISERDCFRWVHQDGRIFWMDYHRFLIRNEEGQIIAVEGIIRDITDTKLQQIELERQNELLLEYAEQLRKANTELTSLDRMKTEFLANTSHELRTPLNSVLGYLEMLKSDFCETEEEKKEYLKRIDDSAKELLDVIEEILAMAQIEAGNICLECTEVEVNDFLQNIKQLYESKMKHRFLSFEVVPLTESCHIRVDVNRLYQIFKSIIENSMKFTIKGKITIAAHRKKKFICFAIEDSGIGISKEDQENIFEKFVQVDGTIKRRYPGLGLGLTISRALTEKMDGSISIYSEGLGKGTTVMIILPVIEKNYEKKTTFE